MDTPTVIEYFRAALMSALRERDRTQTDVLRTLLAALDNAQAVVVPVDRPDDGSGLGSVGVGAQERERRPLTVEEAIAIVRAESAETAAAAVEWKLAGNQEQARRLDARVTMIGRHLVALGFQP